MGQPSTRLLHAYRQTVYRVGSAAVRIGLRSPAMRALLRREGAGTAVLITAWNPMSRRMPPGWNRRVQCGLHARLRLRPVFRAEGQWRAWREEHLLVPGPAARALVLARLYRQQAVVVLRRDGSARLVIT